MASLTESPHEVKCIEGMSRTAHAAATVELWQAIGAEQASPIKYVLASKCNKGRRYFTGRLLAGVPVSTQHLTEARVYDTEAGAYEDACLLLTRYGCSLLVSVMKAQAHRGKAVA